MKIEKDQEEQKEQEDLKDPKDQREQRDQDQELLVRKMYVSNVKEREILLTTAEEKRHECVENVKEWR